MSSRISSASKGNLRELFNFHCAAVMLMDYDDKKTMRFLRVGDFAVNLLVQATQYCSILMCVCVLGDLYWPLARDALVIRVGLRTFVFAVPGLLYGLEFPPFCGTHVMDTLERVFLKFGHYKNLIGSGEGYPFQDNEPQFWKRVRSRIESLVHVTLSKLGQVPGRSPWSNSANFEDAGLMRVLRMSASAKNVCRTFLSCSPKAIHIRIQEPKTRPMMKSKKHKFVVSEDDLMAHASVSVFTDIVDAMEVAWMMSSISTLSKKKKKFDPKYFIFVHDHDNYQQEGLRAWRWNKQGVMAFMKELKSAQVEGKN